MRGVTLYADLGRTPLATLDDAGVGCLAFLRPGLLMTGNTQPEKPERSGCLKLWEQNRCVSKFSGMDASHIARLVAQPGGRVLAACAWDRALIQMDAASGEELARFSADSVMLGGLAGHGRLAASGGMEKVVRIWDLPTEALRAECVGHTGYVGALAFSGDGALLVSASADGSLRGWRSADGHPQFVLSGHSGPVWCLAVSEDARLVLSGSYDETWRLWSVENGKTLAAGRLKGPPLSVWLEPRLMALTQNGYLELLLPQAEPVAKGPFRLMVGDNFEHHGESREVADFATAEAALQACRRVIDEFFQGRRGPQAYADYTSFGPYPYVVGVNFSPYDYARQVTGVTDEPEPEP